MKTIAVLTAALAVLSVAGCSSVRTQLTRGRVPDVINEKPEQGSYYQAIGIGAGDPALTTETQRRSLARDAAIVKAQYELLSLIKGVELDGGYTVSKAISMDSKLATRVHDSIRGARVLKSEFTTDGGCVVTVRLPKEELRRETGLALP
jgi:hypothetical protein